MNNKGIITASIIVGGAYLGGKLIGAKASEKRAKEISTMYKDALKDVFKWAEDYTDRMINKMNEMM